LHLGPVLSAVHTLPKTKPIFFGDAGNATCEGGKSGAPYFAVAQRKFAKQPGGFVSGLSLQVNYEDFSQWMIEPISNAAFAEGLQFFLKEETTETCTMTLAGEPCDSCEFCHNEDGNQTMANGFMWFAVDCSNVVPGLNPTTTCTNPTGWIEFLKQVDKKKPLFDTSTPAPAAPTNSSRTDLMAAAGVGGVVGVVIGVVVGAAGVFFLQSLCRRRRRLASAPASAPEAVATPRSHRDFTTRLTTPATAPPPPPPSEAPMSEVPATGPSITEPVSTLSSRMMMMMMTPRSTYPPIIVATARTPPPPLPIIAEAVLMVDPSRSAVAAFRGDNQHHDNNHDNNQYNNQYNNHDHNNDDENNRYDPETTTNGPLFKDQAQSSYISL
jgi:hypothetical protein